MKHKRKKSSRIYLVKFNENTKYCPRCDRWLNLNYFYRHSDTKSGRRSECKNCSAGLHKTYHIKKSYNLDIREYNLMLEKQKNKCKICNREMNSTKKSLIPCVDHDHITKKIRGLLCGQCNTALGSFNDDINMLKSAIKYLARSARTKRRKENV